MSTLQVKGGSGPAGRTLKTLNNKNNLVALYMRKQLEQLNREHTFCISHLDRDRFETHDFLQHIQRKDSEKHPASIKYVYKYLLLLFIIFTLLHNFSEMYHNRDK
jgi:hypothetical protein